MRIQFGKKESAILFKLEPLVSSIDLSGFSCPVDEYNEYLYKDALRSQNDHIARTWLLWERTTGKIAAFMSLIPHYEETLGAVHLGGNRMGIFEETAKDLLNK